MKRARQLIIFSILSLVSIGCATTEQSAAQTSNTLVAATRDRGTGPTASTTPDDTGTNLRPAIVSRKEWQAADPIGKGIEHSIRFITIHHTAVHQNAGATIETKLRSLQKFSQSESKLASGKTKPVWFDVPYHFYVSVDGRIAEGRDLKYVGDTNTDYDPTGHALIVAEGNFEEENPTPEQLRSIKLLVAWLSDRWKISPTEVKGHDDYASTACPGKNLKALLPSISDAARKPSPELKRD